MVNRDAVHRTVENLKPLFIAHGGEFDVVDITDDGTVKVKLVGACEICSLKDKTSEALRIMFDSANAGVTKIEAV